MIEALTEREQEILVCMAEGLSNQEIGNRLHLAGNTVRWYNSQIYSKLAVSNRVEAVNQARALGLLDTQTDALPTECKHNLPESVTGFVGRRQEINELRGLLDSKRLITILAPGGMGKTRLSVEVARTRISDFPDGVYFVPLAPLSSPNDIVIAIAEHIGFVFHGENPPSEQLVNFLKDRAMLLVLDNFEHLLDGAGLVSHILKSTPNIKIIVTSRERLNLQGETVYSLSGLEFPTWETLDDALEYDAVELFLQSANRVRSDFELHPDDLGFLAQICQLTAGMPLGIELAAGWVDVLSLERIAYEIQQGIDIFETDMRDVPERHRSLRATFERTWNRLTGDQQAIFSRLSVFRGGFTREAAQAVAGTTIRHLHKLVQKSLIQPETNERYHIHELLRQFAAIRLAETDEHAIIEEKHALFFADFMAERNHDIRNKRQIEALRLIDPDFENVRSAWQYIVSHQEWEHVPKLLHSLWFYLDLRARGGRAAELLEPTVTLLHSIASTEISELTLGRVLARLSWFTNDIGSVETAITLCDEALHILRRHDSPEDLLWTLRTRALLAWMENHSDLMLRFSQEGLAIARLIGEKAWEGGFLIWLGSARIYTDSELALQLCEEGVALVEAFEEHHGLMSGIHALSIIKELQHDYEQAAYWNDRLRHLTQSLGHIFLNARSYVAQGRILLAQKDHAGARTNLGKGLQLYWDAGYSWFIAFPLTYIVQLLAEQREFERAVELRAAIDKQLVGFEQSDVVAQALYDQLKTQLEPACFEEAWSRGAERNLGTLVNELLADLNDD
jgi:predicted ATPase/DNA-binding CsgD family transcriptional regulator